ncbi:MFS transporter [Micromonospora sp. DR5-3]|uniref:MFS transporter n=1 Tax=unclassified Micromonospora TaxID=2617518 RepID=UPI0011D92989|nr:MULTISPECIES: MFS transporter [unclassified Micromonospora]MCW3820612.1 MFS transporter [Micromonospora sp. DR5-3]TYC19052.1 MFS transporter [Micromonospora sp. MP36]
MVTSSVSLGRPFWAFWSAAALANVGDGIRLAAFPLLAASLTTSPIGVAAVTAAQALPWLVTGLLAGSLADRRGARTLLAQADVARVIVLGALVVAVMMGWASLPLVLLASFLLGVGETVRDTAAQTALPCLVPDRLLERANGRLAAGEIVGNEFVGPPVGAALFVVGAALPFAANGASLALAVMLVLTLPLSLAGRPPLVATAQVSQGVVAGLRWLVRHRVLRVLVVVTAAVAAADSAWFAILVLYATNRLGTGTVGFGILLAVGALGGLLGSLVADRLVAGRRHRIVVSWSLAITAGIPAVLAVTSQLWAAVLVIVVTSGSFAVLNVTVVSLRQRLVPRELLGRVVAAGRTLSFSTAAAGALLGGVLTSTIGIEAPFVFSGLVAVTATSAWWVASQP